MIVALAIIGSLLCLIVAGVVVFLAYLWYLDRMNQI